MYRYTTHHIHLLIVHLIFYDISFKTKHYLYIHQEIRQILCYYINIQGEHMNLLIIYPFWLDARYASVRNIFNWNRQVIRVVKKQIHMEKDDLVMVNEWMNECIKYKFWTKKMEIYSPRINSLITIKYTFMFITWT